MPVYLITYDTHGEPRNYDDLYEAFENANLGRVTESVWLGELASNLTEVREWVRGLLDDDDTILVIQMKPKHGWAGRKLGTGVAEWISAKIHPPTDR